MRIAIDCRLADSSGVGVYLRGCLPYFLESPHTFTLFGDPAVLHGLAPDADERKREIIPCAVRPFSLSELCAFPRRLRDAINRADRYYSPYFNLPGGITAPVYTTIHDIIFPDMPELTSRAGLAARMWFYRRAFRRSRTVFTVSQFSKSRIAHFLGNAAPIVVTRSAVQPALQGGAPKGVTKKETVLFIGNIKKHKGLPCLLDGFFRARAEGLAHRLVIVGEKDNFRSSDAGSLRDLAHTDPSAVEFTGRVPPESLK
ncbi:MAG: glycosyltransferase, partial [Spirochaetaceae bacterium]|nr:glycosyltransferase [Spirochaetaceae bacterium]